MADHVPPTDQCRLRTTCRLCGSAALRRAFALTPTPPANAFVTADAIDVVQPKFPLDVYFCDACGHVQLLDVVDPAVLFRDYVYVSGTSPAFVRHFEEYARDVAAFAGLQSGDLVVDIGSNDGTLLTPFKAAGYRVLGVDPATAIASAATAAGIETIPAFFTEALANDIRTDHGSAAVVAANNVFAHIDDLSGVLRGVRRLLAPNGVFVFEVSYLLDVIEDTLFDTIYHEHLCYHAVRPLLGFMAAHGMELVEALRVPTHGGSLRGIAQLKGGRHQIGPSVEAALAAEDAASLSKFETYVAFASKIDALGQALRSLLANVKQAGHRIAGFGAPAKATTLMYHFGIGPEQIDFIVDDSPLKQGLYTPGLHVPVLDSSAIATRKPDYLLLLAWNFAAPIIARNQRFRDNGGKFIVPLPDLVVV
jgi:SAM-dependent methyltransferase